MESPEVNALLYGQLMTEETQTYNWVKTIYSINGHGKIGQIHAEKNETKPRSYTINKNKLKMN